MQTFSFIVDKENNNLRLDVYLAKSLPKISSRTFLKDLISKGLVRVNNIVYKPHKKVKEGEGVTVEFEPAKPQELLAENIPLKIIYEDKDILVIDKPVGMVVHPAVGNHTGTLVNALLHHCKKLSDTDNPLRPGIVHRLDKDTSGVMVVAKNNPAHLGLAKQFQEHSIVRKYVAIVEGVVEFNEGMIDVPLGRSQTDREKMVVTFNDSSREARTVYKVLKRLNDKTLLDIFPQTGRTHQIRVHLAYLGHPVLGDKKYGKASLFSRLALHAQSLGFVHPTKNKFMEFKSDLPKEFKQITKGIDNLKD
ncbi:MAG: RluA family pseudouridine synthase [Candidatus Omnitrophota bacterium]|nr:RluA family pseudouridine synthase [Candidatus Omnitrophota bacterium]